jgi:S-adenosylmethionine uptake transporter
MSTPADAAKGGPPAFAGAMAPVFVAALGICLLTTMDGFMKKLTATQNVVDIAFARFFVASVLCLPIVIATRMRAPSRAALKAQALRAGFSLATSLLFITALKHLPLSEAVTLTFLAPSLVALFGRALLGETVSRFTFLAIAISFLGVVAIAWHDVGAWKNPTQDALGILAALGAAICYAISLVLLRARAQADGMVATVALQNFILTAYLAPLSIGAGGAPLIGLGELWPLALAIGALGVGGHLLLAWAYARAPAARMGAVEYSGLVWAVLIGVVWFGEWPGANVLAGAALIVGGSSLLLVRR